MTTEIKVPDLGHDDAVEVIEVLVEAGQRVAKDDPLITIESDKATFEVPAEEAGTITSVTISLGDEVKTGDMIAEFEPGDAGENNADEDSGDKDNSDEADPDAAKASAQSGSGDKASAKPDQDSADDPANKQAGKAQSDSSAKSSSNSAPKSSPRPASYQPPQHAQQDTAQHQAASVNASPQVRKAARELGVDLQYVPAGDDGRVSLQDVQMFVREQFSAVDQSQKTKDNPERYGEVERTPLSKVRAMTAAIMHKSWLEAPQVTHFDEVDISDLEDYRKRNKLSFLPFLLKAVSNTLEEFPLMRSSFDAENPELVQKNYYRIGIAVNTDQGLLRPVLADVDSQNIAEIASSMKTLIDKTRSGRLAPTDQRGAVFTISSLGGMGGTQFTPIVNGPEVGILGVSKTQIKPVYTNGEFLPAMMLPLALSYDHRVIDGVYAAEFMNALKDRLAEMADLLD